MYNILEVCMGEPITSSQKVFLNGDKKKEKYKGSKPTQSTPFFVYQETQMGINRKISKQKNKSFFKKA